MDVKIGAWPLMAPGQLVWIRAYISDRQYDLVKRPVTEDDLKDESIGGSLSYLAIDQQKGKTIRFTCEVNFDNGEGRYFSFTDVDIVITE